MKKIAAYMHKDGLAHIEAKSGAPASVYDNQFPFGTNARAITIVVGDGDTAPKVFTEEEVRTLLKEMAKAAMVGGIFKSGITTIAAKHGIGKL